MGIFIDEKQEKEVVSFLTEEIGKADSERTEFMEKVKKWRRQREARPARKQKVKPWEGASNVAVPVTLTNNNGIFASLKAAFGNRKPFIQVETDRMDLLDHSKALSHYLNLIAESTQHLNIRELNNEILYDTPSLGTEFVKVPWLTDIWSFKKMDKQTGELELVNAVIHDGPAIQPIRIENFITRMHNHDIQRATWIGCINYLEWHELQRFENQGYFENISEIEGLSETELEDGIEDELNRQGFVTEGANLYEIYEVYLYYDIDGDGIPEDIVVWFHKDSGVVLRSEYNSLGVRPIIRIPYLDMPKKLYAMGIGWMCEHLQDEIDALHNIRIDSTLFSAFQMFISKNGSLIKTNEEFFPGKNIKVDNPREDFIPIKFPDVSPSTLQAEMVAKEWASQATGATDAMMGQPDSYAKTRSTATGYLFRAQQGNKLFSSIMTNLEHAYGEMFRMVVYQLIQNKERVDFTLLPEAEIPLLIEILEMPLEDIRRHFVFQIKTTEIDKTEEAKKQSLLMLSQLYTTYAQQMFQLVPIFSNPEVPPQVKEFAATIFVGARKIMEKVFSHFGEKEHDEYLPYTRDMELILDAMNMQKDQQVTMAMQGGQSGVSNRGTAQGTIVPSPGEQGAVANPQTNSPGEAAGGQGQPTQ